MARNKEELDAALASLQGTIQTEAQEVRDAIGALNTTIEELKAAAGAGGVDLTTEIAAVQQAQADIVGIFTPAVPPVTPTA